MTCYRHAYSKKKKVCAVNFFPPICSLAVLSRRTVSAQHPWALMRSQASWGGGKDEAQPATLPPITRCPSCLLRMSIRMEMEREERGVGGI